MEFSRVERDVRRIPGVLACQVTGGEVHVLVAPDADAEAVTVAVRTVLTLAAASPTPVRVIGGRAPIVPMRRMHGRRAFAAVTAGAAALAAAGVAAAVTGGFSPTLPLQPSFGGSESASPPPTISGLGAPETGEPEQGPATRGPRSTSPTTTAVPRVEMQPDRQLAPLVAVGPQVLSFLLPLPGEVAAAPRLQAPKDKPRPEPHVESTVPPTTFPPTTFPPTTFPPTTFPPTTFPPTTLLPTTLPIPAATPRQPIVTATTFYDWHDNDGGERSEDGNGHFLTGPQGPVGEWGGRGKLG